MTGKEGGISGPQFALRSRVLHWVMAALVLAMLFIGVTMVASLGDYPRLVSIHRPLGIAIFVLTIVSLVNRRVTPLPDFLATMSTRERWIAPWSERLLYTLLFAMPLVRWAMLSAGRQPIALFGSLHLPAILPASPMLHALLRTAHTIPLRDVPRGPDRRAVPHDRAPRRCPHAHGWRSASCASGAPLPPFTNEVHPFHARTPPLPAHATCQVAKSSQPSFATPQDRSDIEHVTRLGASLCVIWSVSCDGAAHETVDHRLAGES